ncbi:MAG TPA: type II and III secretion system protein [Burkholderiales bacterium]
MLVLGSLLAAACAQQPLKPSSEHLRADAPKPAGAIPPPVRVSPVLPKPTPAPRPETYSVVVNNVRVQELLFALARDARLQIDIDPELTGTVTLNAIDQTLPQLLNRIARQVDMRYRMDGDTLVVSRDTPYLHAYKVDYLSASRNVKMQSTASTQFGTTTTQTAGPTATGATSTIDVVAQNSLWDSIVQNVHEILGLSGRAAAAPAAPAGAAPQAPGAQVASASQGSTAVIANRETGVLFVRATSRQHEKVQEFLDRVMAGAQRQVLIEATVAEVQLRNEYQRGISWESLRARGLSISQPEILPQTSATPGFTPNPFFMRFISSGGSFTATLKLLEQFGDVRVLSSPKLSVLNNQTAILRVTRDIIYFTITPTTSGTATTLGTVVTQPAFTTTPNVAAEGFMMTVIPQINANDSIVLNVRPTIRRKVADAIDPNPALQVSATNPNAVENRIPIFETREFDSIMRLQSGQIGVLAGLMQDIAERTDTGIPGVRSIPFIGDLLSSRAELSRKTELVIFLRATVIRDPSLEGDFAGFREELPGADYFSRSNPYRDAPPIGPGGEPLR